MIEDHFAGQPPDRRALVHAETGRQEPPRPIVRGLGGRRFIIHHSTFIIFLRLGHDFQQRGSIALGLGGTDALEFQQLLTGGGAAAGQLRERAIAEDEVGRHARLVRNLFPPTLERGEDLGVGRRRGRGRRKGEGGRRKASIGFQFSPPFPLPPSAFPPSTSAADHPVAARHTPTPPCRASPRRQTPSARPPGGSGLRRSAGGSAARSGRR